nr:MAG: hypothetical protein H3Rhizo37772_000003 [Mitovirus sp.]
MDDVPRLQPVEGIINCEVGSLSMTHIRDKVIRSYPMVGI